MPGPFEAVVFDSDGLLFDTEDAWTRAETTLFARRGSAFTADHKRALLGTSVAESAVMLEAMLALPGEGGRLMDELHELVMDEARGGVPVRPGARELVMRLRAEGMPVGLATNSSRAFVELVRAASEFDDEDFDTVVTADDVEHAKPAPDIYLAACRALSSDPLRSVALEDSPPGVAAARNAGMYVIAVPYFEDHTLDGASLVAPSLADPRVAEALGLES